MRNKILLQINKDGTHRVWSSFRDAARHVEAVSHLSSDKKDIASGGTANLTGRASNIRLATIGKTPTAYGSRWVEMDLSAGLDTTEIAKLVFKYDCIKRIEATNWLMLPKDTLDKVNSLLRDSAIAA